MKGYADYMKLKKGQRVTWMRGETRKFGYIAPVWEDTSRKTYAHNRIAVDGEQGTSDIHWMIVQRVVRKGMPVFATVE